MKNAWSRLLSTPHFSRKSALIAALAAALWLVGIGLRDRLIPLSCITLPLSCRPENIWLIDRMTVGLEWSFADWLSFWLQNLSIAAGLFFPLCWRKTYFTDVGVWLVTTLINGVSMEWVRIFVHRPRPFVLKDPDHLGQIAHHYTSFYSGHTSFVAASWTALLILTWTRSKNVALQALMLALWATLPPLTALFRMLCGRHYFTDTAVGWLAGVTIAIAVAIAHRTPSRRS